MKINRLTYNFINLLYQYKVLFNIIGRDKSVLDERLEKQLQTQQKKLDEYIRIKQPPYLIKYQNMKFYFYGKKNNNLGLYEMTETGVSAIIDNVQPDEIQDDTIIHINDYIYQYFNGDNNPPQFVQQDKKIDGIAIYLNNKQQLKKYVINKEVDMFQDNEKSTFLTFYAQSGDLSITIVFQKVEGKIKFNETPPANLNLIIPKIEMVASYQENNVAIIVSETYTPLKQQFQQEIYENNRIIYLFRDILLLLKTALNNRVYITSFKDNNIDEQLICEIGHGNNKRLALSPIALIEKQDKGQQWEKPIALKYDELANINLQSSSIICQGQLLFHSQYIIPDHYIWQFHRYIAFFFSLSFYTVLNDVENEIDEITKNLCEFQQQNVAANFLGIEQCYQTYNKICDNLIQINKHKNLRQNTPLNEKIVKKIFNDIFLVLQIPDPKFNYLQLHDNSPRQKLETTLYQKELDLKEKPINCFLLQQVLESIDKLK